MCGGMGSTAHGGGSGERNMSGSRSWARAMAAAARAIAAVPLGAVSAGSLRNWTMMSSTSLVPSTRRPSSAICSSISARAARPRRCSSSGSNGSVVPIRTQHAYAATPPGA
jgi:hypothetical protein